VQGFYQDRLDAGLSASTVHKVHTILHKALARAVAWQMVPRNVTDAVEPPRPAPKEMRPLSPAEARKLLEAAQGDRLEALYVLAVTTGMRQGELLALKWQDVDLGNATVAITLDTYSHVMPGMGDQTARAMQEALAPVQATLS
jgi:integrase